MAVAAIALVAAAAVPAQAAVLTASTTGAAGRIVYIKNGDWELFARDTLTDGHCARWQRRYYGTSTWYWHGASACSSTEQSVGFAHSNYDYRICRTGVGNCSAVLYP